MPPPSGIAVVRPGDVLLLMFDRRLTEEEVERVAAEFRPHLDPSVKLAILDDAGGCSLAVRPPDPTTLEP